MASAYAQAARNFKGLFGCDGSFPLPYANGIRNGQIYVTE